jgi:endonuclease/exonuclease/phosphatase family metal-dependent hydrolase
VRGPSGEFALVAPHFYAGTRPADARIRRRQVGALVAIMDEAIEHRPAVVAGDLNFPPEAYEDGRPSEMNLMLAAGFRDTVVSSNGQSPVTWSYTRNRYVRSWLQTHKSDMRFDYVLVREGRDSAVESLDANIVFDQRGEEVSDHYGVVVDLSFSRLKAR